MGRVGPGRARRWWLCHFSARSGLIGGRVRLLSALSWLSSCFSLLLPSQMRQSINDWCLPAGLDSSFTWSLSHSCSASSAPGRHVELCGFSFFVCFFLKVLNLIHLHPVFSFLLNFFLCMFVSFVTGRGKVSEGQISPDAILYENQCFHSACPTLYCRSPEHGNKKKKLLFSCRGCNSMLSGPIVLQKLHLLSPSIVYCRCGSSSLNGHNYASLQISKTASHCYQWISVFWKPKVREDCINTFIFLSNRPGSFSH